MEARMVSKSLTSSDSSLSIELTSCLLSRLELRVSGSGFRAFAVECGVWSVECGVLSVESGVLGVEC